MPTPTAAANSVYPFVAVVSSQTSATGRADDTALFFRTKTLPEGSPSTRSGLGAIIDCRIDLHTTKVPLTLTFETAQVIINTTGDVLSWNKASTATPQALGWAWMDARNSLNGITLSSGAATFVAGAMHAFTVMLNPLADTFFRIRATGGDEGRLILFGPDDNLIQCTLINGFPVPSGAFLLAGA